MAKTDRVSPCAGARDERCHPDPGMCACFDRVSLPPDTLREALEEIVEFRVDPDDDAGYCFAEVRKIARAALAAARVDSQPLTDALRTLMLVRRIAEVGPGPDTTPEQALQTIAALVKKRHPESVLRVSLSEAPE